MKKQNNTLVNAKTNSKKSKNKNRKICKTITNVLLDDEEEKKLMLFRREFPAAFDRFLLGNGSKLPIYEPFCHTRSLLLESESESGLGSGSILPLPSKIGDVFHEFLISDEETAQYCILCSWGERVLVPTVIKNAVKEAPEKRNAAIFSDIWIALSIFFCVGSSYYMPDDDYVVDNSFRSEEADSQAHVDGRDSFLKKKKKKKSFAAQTLEVITSNLEVFDVTESQKSVGISKSEHENVLEFSKKGDYINNKQLLGVDLGEESQRIMKIFVGLSLERDVTINWALRASKKEVTIHTCEVPGSIWQAVKSDCIIKQDKYKIVKLLMDDTRSNEYDDTMDGFQVRSHMYHFNSVCTLDIFFIYT